MSPKKPPPGSSKPPSDPPVFKSGYDRLNALDMAASEEYHEGATSKTDKALGTQAGRVSVVTKDLLPSPQMPNPSELSPRTSTPPLHPHHWIGTPGNAQLVPNEFKTPDQLTHFVDLESNHPHNNSDRDSLASGSSSWMGVFSRIGRKLSTAFPVKRPGRNAAQERAVEIYYSVFKNLPEFESRQLLDTSEEDYDSAVHFGEVIESVIEAIAHSIFPRLIAQGSSGSYFAYDEDHEIVGVFKPKDEEPYGPLSPKWTKWLHRNLFPCFFGRSCLIPNTGYICEAAASLLDRRLQTGIVPHTEIVYLSSPTFYYRYFERRRAKNDARLLPRKPGSFQLFLHNYEEADVFFRKHPWPDKRRQQYGTASESDIWTPAVQKQFRLELEKLVILDYIMRNTDRGLDNWMIKLEWVDAATAHHQYHPQGSPSRGATPHSSHSPPKVPRLKIGAIDSGLSWPWKHPDEWRSYPFGWLFLPLDLIGQPFSRETREHFLPLLTSPRWWEESYVEFRDLFSVDPDFRERMWKKQWAVMKGQAFNVVETLKSYDQGPLELARRDKVLIWDGEMDIPVRIPIETLNSAIGTPLPNRASTPLNMHSRRSSVDENLLLPALNSLSVSPSKTQSPYLNSDQIPLLSSYNSTPPSSSAAPSTAPAAVPSQKLRPSRGSSLSLEARYRELEGSPTRKSAGASAGASAGGYAKRHGRRQSLWDELISENATSGPVKVGESSVTDSPINDVGFSHAESSYQATRKVIVERLQIATRKAPFFSWC
ncbi:Phosphatidylinositol 4-kinase type 2-beta [Yarrowia sp. E02]|nr:Phosphatidylinositol 4-kinase type 2-beta [Yarrowia sp. E02]